MGGIIQTILEAVSNPKDVKSRGDNFISLVVQNRKERLKLIREVGPKIVTQATRTATQIKKNIESQTKTQTKTKTEESESKTKGKG